MFEMIENADILFSKKKKSNTIKKKLVNCENMYHLVKQFSKKVLSDLKILLLAFSDLHMKGGHECASEVNDKKLLPNYAAQNILPVVLSKHIWSFCNEKGHIHEHKDVFGFFKTLC